MKISTYARRQLNPFLGTLQIASSNDARAFSANGRLWQIQVLAERPHHTWRSTGDSPPVKQYFNWGMWSNKEGLREVIANPILDIGAMEKAADQLMTAMQPAIASLPFRQSDHFECWACDKESQPVALLASTLHREAARPCSQLKWRALPEDGEAFVSDSLVVNGMPDHDATGQSTHAGFLEQQVERRATEHRWFERAADGSGTSNDGEVELPSAAFPETGICEDWEDPLVAKVFADFIAWNAPLLLTLPLSYAKRLELEQHAIRRASLLDDLHRVYPAVADSTLIEQARVEARLRRSQ